MCLRLAKCSYCFVAAILKSHLFDNALGSNNGALNLLSISLLCLPLMWNSFSQVIASHRTYRWVITWPQSAVLGQQSAIPPSTFLNGHLVRLCNKASFNKLTGGAVDAVAISPPLSDLCGLISLPVTTGSQSQTRRRVSNLTCLLTDLTISASSPGIWSHLTCPPPPAPEITMCYDPNFYKDDYATIIGTNFSVGAVIQYVCAEGSLVSEGDEFRTCQENGEWSGRRSFCLRE